MNTYKHLKATAVDALNQETDRPRRKHFTSLSRHKTPDIRASPRDKDDSKRRSSRGYFSDGPLPSSQTPAPTYPTGAQSLGTANKASYNAPTQPSQGYSAYVSQKASHQNTPLPQESHPTTQRYSVATPDPRATSHRTVAASDKSAFLSPDATRYAEDHYKTSRRRSRQHPTPVLESSQPQVTSTWPPPASFLKRASPEGREREKEQSRNRSKDESKATSKARDKGRTDRTQEHVPRDQRERDPRYEEERRPYKEEQRREKERRREEQRHDEKRYEPRVREDYVPKSTRDQERRRETHDGHVPATSMGKDPRLIRVTVKDSDESDNSLRKPPGSIRPRRHHPKDQTMTAVVPTVLRQSTYPPTPAPAPIPEDNTVSNPNESRRMATSVQPSQATSGASNDRSGMRPQRTSPRQNPTVPYPPGYAVSASDSEHISTREHRTKIAENARSIERPRTSGGHRASIAHDAVSRPPVTHPLQPTSDKNPPKVEKPPKASFSAWVLHREPSNSHPKAGDVHVADQIATQPTRAVPVVPSSIRNDTSRAIPQVVSIRAGEGPADNPKDYVVRHAAPPVANSFATDAAARQPLPTVQVLQQPQPYEKRPRDAPRTVAATQPDLPSHVPTTQNPPSQPWVEPPRWSTEPQPMSPVPQLMSPVPQPMSPVPRPPVVPSPMVFSASLAPPPTQTDTQQYLTPPRTPHVSSSHQESHTYTQESPWHNLTANSRTPAPSIRSHTVPSPATGTGQRTSPQGASHMVHDVNSTKNPRYSSVPTGYTSVQPSYVASPPSRPIAPDLAAAFPIREDAGDAYRHSTQEERPRNAQPSKDTFDHWERHGHNQDTIARMVVSSVPSVERTPRSTRASPSLHPRTVNQGTPPKHAMQPFPVHAFPQQPSTTSNVPHAHDPSRPGVYNMPNQNSGSSSYPAASVYPSSSPRTQVEVNSAINNHHIANAPSNNPSPKVKPGNPSPRSRPQAVAPSQGLAPPMAVHVTTRTPSHETGSTTLLGHTSSSQESASMQLPMSPQAHPQAIVSRATTHGGQQAVLPSAPVSDSLGDRNANATSHNQVPSTRQTSARHHHSNSAPVVSVSSLAQTQPPPLDRSQTLPFPRVPPPASPTPVRSYPTIQSIRDSQVVRMPIPAYPSTPAPNPRQQRDAIPSPSQESELHTPSSLAFSTKLPIVSDEPLAPVMSTQSYQEPKKKSGFFQGLFRSRSSAQRRHPHDSMLIDPRVTTTTTATATVTATKMASTKSPTPLHYDSDSKVATTPSKLKKSKVARTPAISAPHPPPTPVPLPAPSFAGAMEEKFSSAPNAFASFRFVSKRYRTMSGASAEAVDGTNAGASTVLTSPANSTRSPTPKLVPPQRDPQQATYVWRNEAEALQRGPARRRRPRPGVHFESYEDHPQAEHHRFNYATRAREKVRG